MNALLRDPVGVSRTAVGLQYERHVGLARGYGPSGREECELDTAHTARIAGAALWSGSMPLLEWYAHWLATRLTTRGVVHDEVIASLEVLGEVASTRLEAHERERWSDMVTAAMQTAAAVVAQRSPVELDDPVDATRSSYLAAALAGDRSRAVEIAMDAQPTGGGVSTVIAQLLAPCQQELGRRWMRGQISVADEHVATAVTQFVLARMHMGQTFTRSGGAPVLVAACPSEELHELPLRMVCEQLEEAGYDVRYVGASTPVQALAALVATLPAAAVLTSVSMAFCLPALASTIDAIRQSAGEVPIIVGGVPFEIDPALGRRVGADLTARDAREVSAFLT